MSGERPQESPDEREERGRRYLRMLGLEDRADLPIPGHEGYRVAQFLEFCGEHATPLFEGFATLAPGSENYDRIRALLEAQVLQFVTPPPES